MKTNKTPQECIKCGGKKIATFLYGLPKDLESIKEDEKSGKIIIGGCCIHQSNPEWKCNSCGWEWRTTEPIRGRWGEGVVDVSKEHFKIVYGDSQQPLALIGKDTANIFKVQFLVDFCSDNKEAISHLIREVDFYLNHKDEDDHWLYAKYHCSTAANIYSPVHWGYYEAKE